MICETCKQDKDEKFFDLVRKWRRKQCQSCRTKWKQNRRLDRKAELVEFYGNICLDCGYSGPSFMFDFDHNNPEEKEFEISTGISKWYSMEVLIQEADKCDLLCANCHRLRTHKQRCSGCKYCDGF